MALTATQAIIIGCTIGGALVLAALIICCCVTCYRYCRRSAGGGASKSKKKGGSTSSSDAGLYPTGSLDGRQLPAFLVPGGLKGASPGSSLIFPCNGSAACSRVGWTGTYLPPQQPVAAPCGCGQQQCHGCGKLSPYPTQPTYTGVGCHIGINGPQQPDSQYEARAMRGPSACGCDEPFNASFDPQFKLLHPSGPEPSSSPQLLSGFSAVKSVTPTREEKKPVAKTTAVTQTTGSSDKQLQYPEDPFTAKASVTQEAQLNASVSFVNAKYQDDNVDLDQTLAVLRVTEDRGSNDSKLNLVGSAVPVSQITPQCAPKCPPLKEQLIITPTSRVDLSAGASTGTIDPFQAAGFGNQGGGLPPQNGPSMFDVRLRSDVVSPNTYVDPRSQMGGSFPPSAPASSFPPVPQQQQLLGGNRQLVESSRVASNDRFADFQVSNTKSLHVSSDDKTVVDDMFRFLDEDY